MQEIIIPQGFRMEGKFYPASKQPQLVPQRVAVAAIGTKLATEVPEQKSLIQAPENKAMQQAPENK